MLNIIPTRPRVRMISHCATPAQQWDYSYEFLFMLMPVTTTKQHLLSVWIPLGALILVNVQHKQSRTSKFLRDVLFSYFLATHGNFYHKTGFYLIRCCVFCTNFDVCRSLLRCLYLSPTDSHGKSMDRVISSPIPVNTQTVYLVLSQYLKFRDPNDKQSQTWWTLGKQIPFFSFFFLLFHPVCNSIMVLLVQKTSLLTFVLCTLLCLALCVHTVAASIPTLWGNFGHKGQNFREVKI